MNTPPLYEKKVGYLFEKSHHDAWRDTIMNIENSYFPFHLVAYRIPLLLYCDKVKEIKSKICEK